MVIWNLLWKTHEDDTFFLDFEQRVTNVK
jgi:hypothetical protein